MNNTSFNKKGHDIHIEGNFTEQVTKEWIVCSYSTSESAGRVYCGELKQGWLPDVPEIHNPLHIDSTDGKDISGCGASNSRCKTIGFALTQWVSHKHKAIVVCSSKLVESNISVFGLEIQFEKDDAVTDVTVSSNVGSGCLFSVGSGSLELDRWTIVHASGNSRDGSLFIVEGYYGLIDLKVCSIRADSMDASFAKPFFVAEMGEIVLEGCSIEGVCLESSSLFAWEREGNIDVRNGSITRIHRMEGNGAIVEKILQSGEKCDLWNTTISECKCMNGNGGALWVKTTGGSHLNVSSGNKVMKVMNCVAQFNEPDGSAGKSKGGGIYLQLENAEDDFEIVNPQFEWNSATWGSHLFIASPSLKTSVIQERLPFYPDFFGEKDIEGEDGATLNIAIPLVFYLQQREARVSVGDGGFDVSACGFVKYPCRSLDYGFGQESSSNSILFNKSYTWGECFRLDRQKGYIMSGVEGKSEVKMVGNESRLYEMVEIRSSVKITLVAFVLEQSLKQQQTSVFVVEKGEGSSLEITSSSVKGCSNEQTIPYCFVSVKNGKTLLSNVGVEKLSFSAQPFLACDGSNAEISMIQAVFTDVVCTGEHGLIETSNGSIAKISTSRFESERGSTQPVIVAFRAKNVLVNETNTSGLEMKTGDGCFIHGIVGARCEVNVEGGNVSGKCTKGNGGAMWLSMESGGIVHVGKSSLVLVSKSEARSSSGSGGLGGGIFAEAKNSGVDFVLKALEFAECHADLHGHNVFLRAPNFTTSVTNITFEFCRNTMNEDELVGYEGGDDTYAIPLVLYLRGAPLPVIVGGDNKKDFDRCGYEGYGCATIDFVLTRWASTDGLSSAIASAVSLSSEANLSQGAFEFNGTSVNSQIDVRENADKKQDGMIETSSTCLIKGVKIVVPSWLGGRLSLLFTREWSLRVDSCSLSIRLSLSAAYSLFMCTGGTLTLWGVSMRDITFNSGSAVWISEEGACEIVGCTMTNMKGSGTSEGTISYSSRGAMNVENTTVVEEGVADDSCKTLLFDNMGKSMHMRNCSFCNLTRSWVSGCGLSGKLDEGMELVLNGVRWENCSVHGGSGGGCFVELSKTAVLRIGGSGDEILAEKCRALNGDASDASDSLSGVGGGMVVKCIDGGRDFALKDVQFGKEENANEAENGGNNMFVMCGNLSDVVNVNSLNFDFPKAVEERPILEDMMGMENGENEKLIPLVVFFRQSIGGVYVGKKGCNHRLCGFEDYPCEGIKYAATRRASDANVEIVLLRDFVFDNPLVLDAQEMTIKVQGDERDREVIENGEGDSDSMIETKKNTSFECIWFCVPQSFASHRKCFLKCTECSLKLKECSVKSESGEMNYSFVSVQGGELTMEGFSVKGVCVDGHGLVEASGVGSKMELSEANLENVSAVGVEGVLSGRRCSSFKVSNTWMNMTTLSDCAMIRFVECGAVEMRGVNVWNISRQAGDGGAFVGVVGEGGKCEIVGSTFNNVSCLEHNGRGGCGCVEVKAGGTLNVEDNCFEGNGVLGEESFGGGLYLKFCAASVEYSMKQNEFVDNRAGIGKDVYVVCPQPRKVLRLELWEETVKESDERERFWVFDDTSGAVISSSILVMLFPAGEEIVFVNGLFQNNNGCGHEEMPCRDVEYAFKFVIELHTTIRLAGNTFLEGVIDANKTLTVDGANNTKPELEIKPGGQLCVSDAEVVLSLRGLHFKLTSETAKASTYAVSASALSAMNSLSSVLMISQGRCAVVNCLFGEEGEGREEVGRWIVQESGGSVELSSVKFAGLGFGGSWGIVFCEGGEFSCRNTSISQISAGEASLFVSGDYAKWKFKAVNVSSVNAINGRIITLNKGSVLTMSDECVVEGCGASTKNGSFGLCEMSEENELRIENVQMSSWVSDVGRGYGGCLFVAMSEGYANNYLFRDIVLKENDALVGKDMFVECVELNSSILSDRFCIELTSGSDESTVDVKGVDTSRFEDPVDLRLFLIQAHLAIVVVSSEGYDMVGCGEEAYPCHSFWCGYSNTLEGAEKRELRIQNVAEVDRGYDVSSFVIASPSEGEECELHVSGELQNGALDGVFVNSKAAEFRSINFQIPSSMISAIQAIFVSSSTSAELMITHCSISESSGMLTDYGIVKVMGGRLIIENCSFTSLTEHSHAPFAVQGSLRAENCTLTKAKSRTGKEGGLMCIRLGSRDCAKVDGCRMEGCECKAESGKGGAMFVDGSEATEPKCISLNGTFFLSNLAAIGKHLYVGCRDLNTTVTTETFNFSLSEMESDDNDLMGADPIHGETSLLRFLVEFRSSTVHVGAGGYDLLRCGSANDPCQSWRYGIEHLLTETNEKTIVVSGECRYEEDGILSDFEVKSAGAENEEQSTASLIIECSGEEGVDVCMRNTRKLRFEWISFVVREGFANERGGVIVSEGEELEMIDCGVSMKVSASQVSGISYAVVRRGSVIVKRLSVVSSSIGKCLFEVAVDVGCVIEGFKAEMVEMRDGSIIGTRGKQVGKMQIGNGRSAITVVKSEFKNITNNGENGCVFDLGESSSATALDVNASVFKMCMSSNSPKGGAIHFCMGSGGYLHVRDTSITLSSCSAQSGWGGGVYVGAVFAGDLDMMFKSIVFGSNIAHIGRDLFVECYSIKEQINETQFLFDLRESKYNRLNAIYGIDRTELCGEPVNLIEFIVIYQNDTIFTTSDREVASEDSRNCGSQMLPCASLGFAVSHLTHDFESQIVVIGEGLIKGELDVTDASIRSRTTTAAYLRLNTHLERTRPCVVLCTESVVFRGISFVVDPESLKNHFRFVECGQGKTEMTKCTFSGTAYERNNAFAMNATLLYVSSGGYLELENVTLSHVSSSSPMIVCEQKSKLSCTSLVMVSLECSLGLITAKDCEMVAIEKSECQDVVCNGGALFAFEGDSYRKESEDERNKCECAFSVCSIENITMTAGMGEVLFANCLGGLRMQNISFAKCVSREQKGKMLRSERSNAVELESCTFSGDEGERESELNASGKEMCEWNGSVVHFEDSSVVMSFTTIKNAKDGGMSVSGGDMRIERGEFLNNNPDIVKFPSVRRNIICSGEGLVNIESLKGGDGMKDNSSLWFLNEGCRVEGIASERSSTLFIPVLEEVKSEEKGSVMELRFLGSVLIPCELSFKVSTWIGDAEAVERHEFSEADFVSEKEVRGSISSSTIASAPNDAEVSVAIVFGGKGEQHRTTLFVLKNRTEEQTNNNDYLAKGKTENHFSWITVMLMVILFLVLIVAVAFIVRWKKAKNRTKELEEIVNDTVRKDPKAFEMVTMEMSPEDQWRRAEREAEKKNEERIKKRVYEKSLGHSESSEHLLSESGSTEYILGRDSDKIPQWVLEEVDEKEWEEEIQKRSPSPSISSTSTSDTSDTDSTFVRGEDLCPTTSSMSNLVDAMSCSSPYVKLIVDLRDSLFMLLHGKNEKKEMAIGTLVEREVTGAHLLFWVVHGALHSFEDDKYYLPSLANLSPHIILFSEHMEIAIALHSDCFSDDSDSSSTSISSSTIITSSSACSSSNRNGKDSPPPSSAFEEDGYYRKECLRWKAPELQMNKKMSATKESVVFSVGMMLWECLSLKIPFEEYEGDAAGQKIANGERPNMGVISGSRQAGLVAAALLQHGRDRITLCDVKKELIKFFSKNEVTLTMSDAIIDEEQEDDSKANNSRASFSKSGESCT
ncbi:uncharacterized protein MONOS_2023 [Monocercomonoides exilis]|uniref:uncharacterized protein n=1 Tax=Monocercomonoides exilis TaxID=2049356 RepID=UPI00355A9B8A|nr:hypothetical protein MONOS_2023 [Monocercomonoides exilis]|eukprot:MONOS_2023.1-p1 / transcript=MONOS_2023.1 / gene=MONOS_2023 / organism=Monocercomonoides_exilis_PA203 / gene_product=unspecified product / transcript_product=unspecified product / location=Mono_scaffold00039:80206-91206(-) / protein_length=3667 / sequence_SO=supercontig / SO=protein_coding / is_pseudo=false